jgi:Tfp pilus assembly protein PilX
MRNNQKGFVLITSLLLLALISIIAVSVMSGLRTSAVLSRNESNVHKAFYASETSLSTGEGWVQAQTSYPDPSDCDIASACNANEVWLSTSSGLTFTGFMDPAWWQLHGRSASFVHDGNGHYILQDRVFLRDDLSFEGNSGRIGTTIYHVVSEGLAEDKVTRVVLESTYAKRYR